MSASDKELLELAAKAAGNLKFIPHCGWIHEASDGTRGNWWSPLNNDGDALRLAVNLGITVNQYSKSILAAATAHGRRYIIEQSFGDDAYAATRRAIVRTAAKIGKVGEK